MRISSIGSITIFIFAFLLAPCFAFSASYYWVGNSGNWSDLSHWATSSGGSTFHLSVPGTGDDVFFDSKSFTVPNAEVIFNNEFSYVRDLNINPTNAPKFKAGNASYNLVIGRNVSFAGNFDWLYNGTVQLVSAGSANQIGFGGKTIGKTLYVDGPGSWEIISPFRVDGGLILNEGSISFKTDSVRCAYFESSSTRQRSIKWNNVLFYIEKSSELLDDDSFYWDQNKYAFRANMFNLTTTAQAGNYIIFEGEISDLILLDGGNQTFNAGNIIKTKQSGRFWIIDPQNRTNLNLLGNLESSSSMDIAVGLKLNTFLFFPGTVITINPTQSIEAAQMLLNGRCDATITVWSAIAGTPVLMKINNPVTANYGIFRDIHNSGSILTVQNGVDLGNNVGVRVSSSPGKQFFWIGKNGNWSVGANWSNSSGGPPQACIPSISDDVIFDANSFNASGQRVVIDATNVFCNSMKWEASVTSGSGIASQKHQNLLINGSLYFQPQMVNELEGDVSFVSGNPNNEIQCAGHQFRKNINFTNVGGSWKLLDELVVRKELFLNSGQLILNGQILMAYYFTSGGNEKRTLDLSNSTIIMSTFYSDDYFPLFRYSDDNFFVVSDNSLISFIAGSSNMNCYYDKYPPKSPQRVVFDKVNFASLGYVSNYIQNSTIHINKLTMNSGGLMRLNSTMEVDTLIIRTDYSYVFEKVNDQDIPDIGLKLKSIRVIKDNCEGFASVQSKPYGKNFFFDFPDVPIIQNIESRYLDYRSPGQVIANASVDGGFNSNIVFNNNIGRKLYFVNKDNDWVSTANWSLTSGGTGGECIPTILDTVIFDNKSFDNFNQNVFVSGSGFAYCKDFYFDVPGFNGFLGLSRLFVHGNIDFKQKIDISGTELHMSGKDKQFIDVKGSVFGSFYLTALDSVVLKSDFATSYSLFLEYGTFFTGPHNTSSYFQTTIPASSGALHINYGSGKHTLNYDYIAGSALEFSRNVIVECGTSEFIFKGINTAATFNENIKLYDMTFTAGTGQAYLYFYGDRGALSANKISFGSNATVDARYGSEKSILTDTLIFTAGKTYNFDPSFYYEVKEHFRAIGNNCNSINFISGRSDRKVDFRMPASADLLMNFVQLKGISASGGNAFNAGAFSINVENSSQGWFFPDKSTVEENIGILGKDISVCEGEKVIFSANTNSPGETYLWSDNSTSAMFSPTVSGEYGVLIRYQNNCEVRDTVEVQFAKIPSFDLGPDKTVCAGTEEVLNIVVQADSLVWQDGQSGGQYTVKEAGSYILSAFNMGCQFKDTFNFNVLNITTFDFGSDTTLCGDATLTLILNPEVGEVIQWNDMSTNDTLKVDKGGTYFATIDNGQCKFADTILVSYIDLPQNFLNPALSVCTGDTAVISPGLAGVNYLWRDGTSGPTITAYKSGTFWLRITSGACMAADTIDVAFKPLPDPGIQKSLSICEGQEVEVTPCCQFDEVKWEDTGLTGLRVFAQPGVFKYTATLSDCQLTDSIIIQEIFLEDVNLGPDLSLCEGGFKHLDAGVENVNTLWSTGSTMKEINVNQTGLYFASISRDGCSKTDSIFIEFKVLPDPGTEDVYTFCEGAEVMISVPQAAVDSLRWSDGSTLLNKVFSSEGLFGLKAYRNGCMSENQFEVKKVVFDAFVENTSFDLCPESEVVLQVINPSGLEIVWSDGSNEDQLKVDESGQFTATISSNNCEEQFIFDVKAISCTRFEMNFPNIVSLSSFENNLFLGQVVDGASLNSYEIKVFDRYGSVVFQSNDPAVGWDGKFSKQQVIGGVFTYLVKVNYNDDYVSNVDDSILGSITIIP